VGKVARGVTNIADLSVYPLDIKRTDKGTVFHIFRRGEAYFSEVSEVYASMTQPGTIKGWKLHKRISQNFVVPIGKVKFVFFDGRQHSSTKGQILEVEIGEDNYCLLKVPHGIWYSFKTVSSVPSYIVNCTDEVHDPDESISESLTSKNIPYSW